MRLYGECLCPLLFKLQFILGKIVPRTDVPPGISPRDHWIKKLRNWSRIRWKLQVFQWSIGSSKCGKRQPCLLTRQFRSRLQKLVFSDSLLCLWGFSSNPVKAWKEKINRFMESRQFRELDRIDGEPMEFEWKIFPGFTAVGILAENQKMRTEVWTWSLPRKDHLHANVSRHWMVKTRKPRNLYCEFFSESGHPVFRGSSAFERGDLKSNGKWRSTFHFNGSDETVGVVLRTVISVKSPKSPKPGTLNPKPQNQKS